MIMWSVTYKIESYLTTVQFTEVLHSVTVVATGENDRAMVVPVYRSDG